MPKLDEFPFDATVVLEELDGFNKLRAIKEPKLRELVFDFMCERERRSRGSQWKPARRQAEQQVLKPASREFIDRKSQAGGDDS